MFKKIEGSKGVERRQDGRVRFLALGIFIAVFSFTFLMQMFKGGRAEVEAASLANFDPGYIISDWQMGNYNSMSEAEIQAWLTSKNSCANTNYNYYLSLSANKNYTWHFENGHFICLSEERFGDNDNEIGFQYSESAAHIIWQAAQDYRINPQVLLVLLQKETGLITDPIPNNGDYRKATGYGCPDTAACSSKYYGFKNQIRNAASLFRTVLDGGWTNYPLGENYIQYNPNASCGGSVVNIRSLATSALYRYTPYQPNEGALAAGYGTAYCGAYGNRNFYLYFEDWFGGVTDEKYVCIHGEKVGGLDGIYEISPVASEDTRLASAGINVEIRDVRQSWRFIYNSADDTYTIKNLVTGKVLDVAGGSMVAGTNVQLWEENGSCAQKWYIEQKENQYIFISACSGLALDAAGGSMTNGTNIQVWDANDTNAQKWKIEKVNNTEENESAESTSSNIIDGENDYIIESIVNNSKTIDIAGGAEGARNGTNIQLWDANGTNAQSWRFIYNSADDTYTIKNLVTGKVLDVAGGSMVAGTNVQLWEENGSCAQKWYIEQKENQYIFISACSGLALDAAGGSMTNGTNIQVWDANDTNAQKWKIEKVNPTLDNL